MPKIFLICDRCGYDWTFHGRGNYAKCPVCGKNIRVRDPDGVLLASLEEFDE